MPDHFRGGGGGESAPPQPPLVLLLSEALGLCAPHTTPLKHCAPKTLCPSDTPVYCSPGTRRCLTVVHPTNARPQGHSADGLPCARGNGLWRAHGGKRHGVPGAPCGRGRGRPGGCERRAPGALQPPPPPPHVTFRRVVAPLRGPGQSPVLPSACCVGSLRSVGRCGRCSCWCRFRVRGAQWLVCWGCAVPPPPSRGCP